ncbi:type II toxin-antitoxin system RelE/ParE family toxin [Desulfomicrobium sp. ZS1]|uniref:type II toxin-antitoxin system RelE family toxin n=1 Tax=Desulfomicrobium sp. ZS1 TaxID=2952228 RepID=UPI0020B426C4|nr:type II toxin-antitoxin system RelE/ParE family toxin [Desulfomicrobium sp. ZS1]UTF49413.1 type II toxin-antitoxin system RelE/ParE family toxin [Desulfomicrobium sp. ZS1]
MKIEFKSSFQKDLNSLQRDEKLFARIKEIILLVESSNSIEAVGNVKKLKSDGLYYRIRIGDYRMGMIVEGDTAIFVRILHRSRIYRYFP